MRIKKDYDRFLVIELIEAYVNASTFQFHRRQANIYLLRLIFFLILRDLEGVPFVIGSHTIFGKFIKTSFPTEHRLWHYIQLV